jgi:hypothetical protein
MSSKHSTGANATASALTPSVIPCEQKAPLAPPPPPPPPPPARLSQIKENSIEKDAKEFEEELKWVASKCEGAFSRGRSYSLYDYKLAVVFKRFKPKSKHSIDLWFKFGAIVCAVFGGNWKDENKINFQRRAMDKRIAEAGSLAQQLNKE